MKTIGEAARFFLARHWERTRIGPYIVTTTEVRPSAYETSVTWGQGGPEVEQFGFGLALELAGALVNHEATCERVEASAGVVRAPGHHMPAA